MPTVQQITDTALLPTDFIMSNWKPDPTGNSWSDEMAALRSSGELHALSEEIMREGFRPDLPVMLGGDGEVWVGKDRVIAAYMKGVRFIHCTFGFVKD